MSSAVFWTHYQSSNSMSTYEYQCPNCNKEFDVVHPMRDTPCVLCPDLDCRAKSLAEPCDRLISAPAVCVPYDQQSAPNINKYHGTKPIKDIVFAREDGSGIDVIKSEHNSEY